MNIPDEALERAYQSILQKEMKLAEEKLSPEDVSWIIQQNSPQDAIIRIISITKSGFMVSLNVYNQLKKRC